MLVLGALCLYQGVAIGNSLLILGSVLNTSTTVPRIVTIGLLIKGPSRNIQPARRFGPAIGYPYPHTNMFLRECVLLHLTWTGDLCYIPLHYAYYMNNSQVVTIVIICLVLIQRYLKMTVSFRCPQFCKHLEL